MCVVKSSYNAMVIQTAHGHERITVAQSISMALSLLPLPEVDCDSLGRLTDDRAPPSTLPEPVNGAGVAEAESVSDSSRGCEDGAGDAGAAGSSTRLRGARPDRVTPVPENETWTHTVSTACID